MEAIMLLYRGEALRIFELGERGLEVGRDAGCDIVVHDPEVPGRHLLLRRDERGVVATHLDGSLGASGTRVSVVLRPGAPFELSSRHAIQIVPDAPTRPHTGVARTEPIPLREDELPRLSLVVGRGAEARRTPIGAHPLTVGNSPSCDIRIPDRAVSARHCRIEPGREGILVRDLGSRNGTYVDGVRSFVARIGPGTRLRVGRSDLLVVARGESGDARSDGLVASSPAMIEVLELVERYAQLSFHALVLGETGAGKEGVARALHMRGPRRDRPFVVVNAGALAPNLVESELFGHEKGAFTGAVTTRRGVFEQADGGTLFLDEIGELPLDLQTRLLRVLETKEVRRVGSEHSLRVDVRVVGATHRDLHAMIDEGTFRQDLYYRLAGVVLKVPPLRARPDDVRALAQHFLAAAACEVGPRALSEAALERLSAYDWPGNARELRNVIQNAAAASAGIVDATDVDAAIETIAGPRAWRRRSGELSVAEIVERCGGNESEAARLLGIPRSTLRDRIRAERVKARAG